MQPGFFIPVCSMHRERRVFPRSHWRFKLAVSAEPIAIEQRRNAQHALSNIPFLNQIQSCRNLPAFRPSEPRSPEFQSENSPRSLARRPTFTTPPKSSSGLNDLKSFDVIRYAQKACSNLAILDLVRRQRRAGRCRERRRNSPRLGRRISRTARDAEAPPPIVYTADIFDRSSARSGRRNTAFTSIAARPT